MFNQKRLEQKKKGYSIRSDRVNAKQSIDVCFSKKERARKKLSVRSNK
jgi:hypothetical protein